MSEGTTSSAKDSFLLSASRWVILVAGSLYLLKELGVILKPLFLAVLLGYIIIPLHLVIKQRFRGRFSVFVLAGLSIAVIVGLAYLIQMNIAEFRRYWPELELGAGRLRTQVMEFGERQSPWLANLIAEATKVEAEGEGLVKDFTNRMLGLAADVLSTSLVVGLYLVFLLLEASRFPTRVSRAFSIDASVPIMQTINEINQGISHYLRAKMNASLVLAVPIFVILFIFQTKFALIWAVLVFAGNFIPYLGSFVGFLLPATFALLQFGIGWEAITIAILMLIVHLSTASFIEPRIIGKAVGVSPVIILLTLAFWGYCWGLTGMLLAVPLTVIMKITFEHIDVTRPLARLMSDE